MTGNIFPYKHVATQAVSNLGEMAEITVENSGLRSYNFMFRFPHTVM